MVLAPKSGAETRRYLGEHAGSARDCIGRGRELYEKGRELADEAAQLYEDGRHLVEGYRSMISIPEFRNEPYLDFYAA